MKRNCVRLDRCDRAIVCMDGLPGDWSEGRSTYFRLRSWKMLSVSELGDFETGTYQEESVGHERIAKHSPSDPSSCAGAGIHNTADANCDNHTDELVARVCHEIIDLALGVDVKEVPAQPENYQFENNDDTGIGESDAEKLRLKFAVEASDEGRKEDVGDESHDGDVHVWHLVSCQSGGLKGGSRLTRRVDILSRRQKLCGLSVGAHPRLLSAPGPVSPGKEYDEELLHYIGIGHVEIVLHGRDVDVAIELCPR